VTYRIQLISTAALIGVISAPAWAQNEGSAEAPAAASPSAAPTADQSGEILVTARRRSENIAKVPISITVLSGETLKQKQVTSEIDLQRSVPGLTVRQSGSANQFNFALRGQSVDTYSGSPPAVLAYIDEAQIVQQSAGTFYDLEGIQVLKGPQGTLFGRNSTGGAILFQTAKPSDKFGGYLIGRYGNHSSKHLEGAVNIPLGDIGGFRLAGVYDGGGAYVKNLFTGKMLGKKDVKSIRGTLLLKPLDGLTNTTVVQHSWEGGNNVPTMLYSAYKCGSPASNTTADCTYGPLDPAFNTWLGTHPVFANNPALNQGVDHWADVQRKLGPWKAATEVPLYHRAKSTFVINTTNFELSPTLTLKNILAYNNSKANDGFDYDGTPYPIFTTWGTLSADGTRLTNANRHGFIPQTKQFSEEFQIQGKAFDNRLVYVIGAYYLDQTYDITSWLKGFDGLFPPTNFAYQAQQKDKAQALFAQGTYKITDKLSFTGGFRYSWDQLTQTTGKDSAYFPFFGRAPEKLKASKPSWTVSLDYQATPSLLVYVAHRGSWRTGGFNYSTPPVQVSAAQGGNTFNPETSKDVELGAKFSGRDLGVPVSASIALYQQWVSNVQRAAYVPGFNGPGLVTVNVPKARIKGVEADLSVRAAPWLTFGGALAYTDAKFTKNVVTLFDPVSQSSFDTFYGPFADTPKWTGSAFFDVTHDLGGDTGKLAWHADIYFQSKFTFSNVAATLAPESFIKSYSLVNMRVSWNDMLGTKLSAAFYVRNLLNKKYYTGGNSLGPTLGENTSVSGQPRMFGGELRFDF
jgi:iron complex outermembrane receptor protein